MIVPKAFWNGAELFSIKQDGVVVGAMISPPPISEPDYE